jgi:hypothetical protein
MTVINKFVALMSGSAQDITPAGTSTPTAVRDNAGIALIDRDDVRYRETTELDGINATFGDSTRIPTPTVHTVIVS